MSTINAGWRGPNIVKDGLVLYLDASSGTSYSPLNSGTTWRDISGNTNNGTLTNGPTFSSANGGSIVFDGVDDLILGSFSYTFLQGFSVEMWVYINSRVSYPDDEGLWRVSSSVTNRLNLRRSNVSSNVWRYEVTGPNGTTSTTGMEFTATTDGVWSNLVCDYDGLQTLKVYHNAVLTKTGTFNIGQVTSTSFEIARNSAAPYLEGRVPVFKIYNRALSSTEVLQNYNSTKARFGL